MAPKTTIHPQKQATILSWLQKTALAYSIKDLEKLLPAVASINSMTVKDYMQALQDDGLIQSEKIGNGNWYWSFPSEAKKIKEEALAKAQAQHDEASATSTELQARIDQIGAARAEDEVLLAGGDLKALVTDHEQLTQQVDRLRAELVIYSEHDPVELEKKIEDTKRLRTAAEKYTEHIYCMEGWLKEHVQERAVQVFLLKDYYNDEWDDEEGGLREL